MTTLQQEAYVTNEFESKVQHRLFSALAEGECADLCEFFPDKDSVVRAGENSGKLEAGIIVEVAVGRHPQAPLSPKGIWIKGAHISGVLDFEGISFPAPLRFQDCVFEEKINLQFARLGRLEFSSCRLCKPLDADGCMIDGDVVMLDTCCNGPVSFPAATVNGRVLLDGMRIDPGVPGAPNGDRPEAERERLGQSAYHAAFNGALIKVANGIFFREGFCALGVIDLHNSDIRGNVEFVGAHVITNAPNIDYIAIDLANSHIDGYLFFRGNSIITGNVDLFMSSVDLLDIRQSVIGVARDFYSDRVSFDAENILVSGNLTIRDGAVLTNGFNLKASVVKSLLQFGADAPPKEGVETVSPIIHGCFDLTHAKLGRWSIDFDAWHGNHERINHGMRPLLNGCEYWDISRIGNHEFAHAETLIKWLKTAQDGRHDHDPSWEWRSFFKRRDEDRLIHHYPQPAEYLISVLRRNGRHGDSRKVLVWKRKSAISSIPKSKKVLPCRWLLRLVSYVYYFFSCLFGFGGNVKHMVVMTFVFIFGFALLFQVAYENDQIGITREYVYLSSKHAEASVTEIPGQLCKSGWFDCLSETFTFSKYKSYPEGKINVEWPPAEYTTFNALAYSIDVFLPIINLHQEESWLPKSNWVWWGLWAEVVVGWIMSTLFVGLLTGFIKNE